MDFVVEHAENFFMVMFAPRGSGKSYLLKHLVANNDFRSNFDYVVIAGKSVNLNRDYNEVRKLPEVLVTDKVDKHFLNGVFGTQEQRKLIFEDQVRRDVDVRAQSQPPFVLLILDDVIDTGVITFKGVADKFAERGRHVQLSVIVTSQRITAVSRGIRSNTNYVMIFQPTIQTETERVLEEMVRKKYRKAFLDIVYAIWEEIPYSFIMASYIVQNGRRRIDTFYYGDTNNFVNDKIQPFNVRDIFEEIYLD